MDTVTQAPRTVASFPGNPTIHDPFGITTEHSNAGSFLPAMPSVRII